MFQCSGGRCDWDISPPKDSPTATPCRALKSSLFLWMVRNAPLRPSKGSSEENPRLLAMANGRLETNPDDPGDLFVSPRVS